MRRKISFPFQTFAIWFVLIGLGIFFSIMSPAFLRPDNLFNIGKQVAVLGILSVGMACVILTGGIDLTVGSLLAVTGTIGAMLMVNVGMHPVPAAIIAALASTLVGFISGVTIVYFHVPPLITTLAFMTVFRGVAYLLTKGQPVYGLPKGFVVLGQGYLWLVPIPTVFMFAIFALGSFFLNWTKLGLYVYALGGNEEATRLSGINIKRLRILVYVISGTLAGISGVLLLARLNSGQPTVGWDTALDVITAVVLGGVSIFGGEGKLSGVLAGAFIMGVLSNGLIILGVGEYYQMVVKGMVLVIAVAIDQHSKIRKQKVVQPSIES
jgi:ribose transport system permease protein